ncbi:hypothetical protein [Methylobacterium frigidaeris]|uniref:Uncharacterized protein n=1 Tax=Methylobacterium frigidaeris TaxID=2038277 RepID=A0AA37HGQ2_9HYPH|nr:hypothetical protein [Methylobacterium frigidaeris]GJD65553.1 hypothetical protein MPEAHAMD_5748 [Methylobacterium frigidaeris]
MSTLLVEVSPWKVHFRWSWIVRDPVRLRTTKQFASVHNTRTQSPTGTSTRNAG